MSTTQDAIDLTAPPLTAPVTPPRRRAASPAHEDASDVPGGSERRRQKRRRVDVDSNVEHVAADDADPQSESQQPSPPSTVFTQISTWEIPPDVVPDNQPLPTGENPRTTPVDQPIVASSSDTVPIDLSDLGSPTIVATPKADRVSTPPIVTHNKPEASPSSSTAITPSITSAPEPLSAYTCPICLSPPTNATLTPCGHICCGQCLFTAVKSTIRRNRVVAMERAPEARCPVCRAEIPGWDGLGGGVIGLKMQVLYSL